VTDLHSHSPYSRATSKHMTLEIRARNCKIKGVDILGTGDFTHPVWLEDLKKQLPSDSDGVYEYGDIRYILSGEISLIYKQDGKGRRIHYVILAPDFATVDQINEWLDTKGRRDYDGRPIFGFSSIEFVDVMMGISKDIEIIPAHAWTPWFSIFGSMSGFDSIKECFREKTKYIHAIETGLSSDPKMNWRIPGLDDITLISNSDAHSPYPWRLGREATVLDIDPDYKSVINAIRTRKGIMYTIEVDPNYGKYHVDGHRNCNFSCTPEETKKLNGKCPKCGASLIIGVLSRVEELAEREEGYKPKNAIDFKSLIPLSEIISTIIGKGIATKSVWEIYNHLIAKFGTELDILLETPKEELKKSVSEKIADAIIMNRKGKIVIIPGYDGVYGKLTFPSEEQKSLTSF